MRRHYIDEENLTYADGLAAGETIRVLHEGRESGVSAGPVKALAVGTLASMAVMTATTLKWVRENWFFPGQDAMKVGFNISCWALDRVCWLAFVSVWRWDSAR
jgi:hypothetical protein